MFDSTDDWYTYLTGRSGRYTKVFVQAPTENIARALLADTCDDFDLRDEDTYLYRADEAIPEPGAPRVVDLHHVNLAKNVGSLRTDGKPQALVMPYEREEYTAWESTEYINEARYDGTHGYGVRVWKDSVSKVEPVNKYGGDKSNRTFGVPAYGNASRDVLGSRGKPQRLGATGYSMNLGGGIYAAWFPDKADAEAFRDSVAAWQKALPKFKITDHA